MHLQSIGFPLIGDPAYGGSYRRPKSGDEGLEDVLKDFKRQALVAARLGLQHPVSHRSLNWSVEPPDDFCELLDFLDD